MTTCAPRLPGPAGMRAHSRHRRTFVSDMLTAVHPAGRTVDVQVRASGLPAAQVPRGMRTERCATPYSAAQHPFRVPSCSAARMAPCIKFLDFFINAPSWQVAFWVLTCRGCTGDQGLIGIAAQLATVGDTQLARVLSSHLSGTLPCVVVADRDSRQRLIDGLPGPNPFVPNFAILTHMLPYRCGRAKQACMLADALCILSLIVPTCVQHHLLRLQKCSCRRLRALVVRET